MKVSWLRFHPDTTGSSVIKQIVGPAPTVSGRQSWPLAQWGPRQEQVRPLLRPLPEVPVESGGEGSAGLATCSGDREEVKSQKKPSVERDRGDMGS